MGFEKLQNINDLDSQEILRDLYFNYITANPLSFGREYGEALIIRFQKTL